MARSLKGGSTIEEVAVAAGVSRATVSRVMNGRTSVAPEIAARVHAAADRLQYRPSNIARSLSLGRTNTVALVVPDLGNPMFQQVLRGAMAAAAESGYRVLVAETAESATEEAEAALEARLRCDALILASPRMPEEELAALLPRAAPLIVLNRPVAEAPTLAVDYAHGMEAIVDHLVGLGHRDLAYLAGPSNAASNQARLRGLDEAVRRHPFLRVRTIPAGTTIEDGYRVGDEVLESRATSALAFNDLVAFGLLARLNETGVAVPGDISVTGFDGIELSRYATPSLTTSSVSQFALGRRAWERLVMAIESERAGEQAVPEPEMIEPELVVRGSSGPVPPARRLGMPSPGIAAGAAQQPVAGDDTRAHWRVDPLGAVLEHRDLPLARYSDGTGMPQVHSPRPYLHPIHSLSGRAVTQVSPVDHRHHYGLSLTIADVDGTSYWGGRTFLPGQGPTLLRNHGRQISTGVDIDESGACLRESITWADQHDRQQLLEERELTGVIIPEVEAWAMGWHSRLTAPSGATISSPALRGRPGAGYGGIFCRLVSADSTEVLTADADTELGAHGSRSPWIAFGGRHSREWTTVVLVQDSGAEPLPWFVRVADYVGAGPALAWDETCVIGAGAALDAGLVTLVVDRRLSTQDAADLADLALARVATARRGVR
jgi:LacI family transcriptional regulator